MRTTLTAQALDDHIPKTDLKKWGVYFRKKIHSYLPARLNFEHI